MGIHKSNGNGVLVPAVGYIRMSSDKQEASPAQQRTEITKLGDRDGYDIIRWYTDDNIAGWKEEREDFQRLISDIDRGDFKAVLVWDQNRFSRFEPMEANYYWFQLDRAGIHLCSVNQRKIDWHSIAGWLTASIRQHADSGASDADSGACWTMTSGTRAPSASPYQARTAPRQHARRWATSRSCQGGNGRRN